MYQANVRFITKTEMFLSVMKIKLRLCKILSYKVCVIVDSPQLADLWPINRASDGPNHYLGIGYQLHTNFIPSPDDCSIARF